MKPSLRRWLLLLALFSYGLHCSAQSDKPASKPPRLPAGEYNLQSWKEFSSAAGRFSVLLPGVPTEEVQAIDTAIGKINMHSFSLLASSHYTIMFVDYPLLIEEPNKVNMHLDSGRDQVVKNVKGQIIEEQKINLDGHPGRYLKIQTGSGFLIRSKIIAVKNRVYTLALLTKEQNAPAVVIRFNEGAAAKFLDSFTLTPDKDAKNVILGDPVSHDAGTDTEGEVDKLAKQLHGTNLVGVAANSTSDLTQGGALENGVINKPPPEYPLIAKAAHVSGTVSVRVILNEEGKVIAAQADSGHPLLRAAAVKAAREVQFKPTLLNGKPVKVMGVIKYNFTLK